ncbi:hypothetical protein ACFLV0_04870 [Chloroflexota bacterium]
MFRGDKTGLFSNYISERVKSLAGLDQCWRIAGWGKALDNRIEGYYSRVRFALLNAGIPHRWVLTGQRGRSQSIVVAYRRLLID